MKAVIQRVNSAHVTVNHHIIGKIDAGLLVFLGIKHEDTTLQTKWLAEKIATLRIFTDAQGKMNLSVKDLQFGILVISQFTLYGNCINGKTARFYPSSQTRNCRAALQRFYPKTKQLVRLPSPNRQLWCQHASTSSQQWPSYLHPRNPGKRKLERGSPKLCGFLSQV